MSPSDSQGSCVPRPRRDAGAASASAPAPEARRVLLVEDQAADARLVRELLAEAVRFEFTVSHAARLGDALAALAQAGHDVALLDLSLPDASGMEAVMRLHEAAPALPIIVLTGRHDRMLEVSAMRSGVEDYLEKPGLTASALERAVAHTLDRRRAAAALAESEARYRGLFENEADAVVVFDAENRRIEDANLAAVELFRYEREALIGKRMDALSAEPEATVSVVNRLISRERGARLVSERDVRRGDGSLVPVEVSARIFHAGGRRKVISIVRDISARRRAEREIRLIRELRDAAVAADSFEAALAVTVDRICETLGFDYGDAWVPDADGEALICTPHWYGDRVRLAGFRRRSEALRFGRGEGLQGRIWERGEADWIPDIGAVDARRLVRADAGREAGMRAALGIRVAGADGRLLAVLTFFLFRGDRVEPRLVDVAIAAADQAGMVFERKHAESALRESEARYRALYDDNPSVYFTIDDGGRILSVNRFGARLLGYAQEALTGRSVLELAPDADREIVRRHIASALRAPEQLHYWEARKQRSDGEEIWVRETARVTRSGPGRPVLLLVCEDITEARKLSEEVSWQASHDDLTGLVNRREFERRLGHALQGARIEKREHVMCFLDLDQFKVVNDTSGHAAGDELLRQISLHLREHVRREDTLARLGGDEFGLLIENCPLSTGWQVAAELRAAVEGFRFVWGERAFSLSTSIGLVSVDETSESVQVLLSAADTACYAAKEEGRNRLNVYDPENEALARRHGEMEWVARIAAALDADRFRLDYQSIAPARPGRDAGTHIELLLRMLDEHGSVVMPGTFLPAAERFNLSGRIDRWVVSSALAWLTAHPEHLRCLSLCCINLSARSLGDADFLEFVLHSLKSSGIPPQKICFEVTETAAISNLSGAVDFMQRLRGAGCRFALDDFGSGMSSFAYLKHLPVDYLKIDGIFVRDILEDPVNLALVRSVNEIGKVMGKQTVAEFVEDEATREELCRLGVDYVQGYGIARPGPLADMPPCR